MIYSSYHRSIMNAALSAFILFGVVASVLASSSLVLHGHNSVSSASQAHSIGNTTIAGTDKGCKHRSNYFVNPNIKFQMCTGQTDQDLKNGMSIINLINSRGFLPTCRVMQLMLWMAGTVNDKGYVGRELFVDVGANIGSCSVHMAALGFPVVSVEPVQQHVDTIRGSIEINPAFHIDLHHIGLSSEDRQIRANFGHGARNWGASEFHEVGKNDSFEAELKLRTLEHVVGHRRVALLKVDCEGCEWETIKSAKRMLKRIPMIKMELVQNDYTAGNETMTAHQIVLFLNKTNFDIYADHWNEQDLYFGKHHQKVLDIDRLFGSEKHNLPANPGALYEAARVILRSPIDAATFNQKTFLKSHTDIIAIERGLSTRMKKYFLDI